MKNVLKTTMVIALMAIVASPLVADDEKKAKKAKGKRGSFLLNQTMKKLEKAELTDEQKEKITKLAKEWQPKVAEIMGKAKVTKEQREKMTAARKDGKKGKEILAAAGLSDEQQKAQAEANKLRGEFTKAVNGLLTAEQKEKAGIKERKAKGKVKKGAAKKKKKDAE